MEDNQTYLGVVQGYTSVEVMSSADGFDALCFADIGRHGHVGDQGQGQSDSRPERDFVGLVAFDKETLRVKSQC